jgi:hypothetical protein
MEDKASAADFAPHDPTDGRQPGQWESRYPMKALERIWFEAAYLFVCFSLVPGLLLYLSAGAPAPLSDGQATPTSQGSAPGLGSVEQPKQTNAAHAAAGGGPAWIAFWYAWLGGTLGGTLFSIKWFYHSVAKNIWNADRIFWRLFTPHVSGALGAVFVTLCASGMLVVFDKKAFSSVWICFGLAFLVGYFSDHAVAKLSEVAQTLFGTSHTPTKRRQRKPKNPNKGTADADA